MFGIRNERLKRLELIYSLYKKGLRNKDISEQQDRLKFRMKKYPLVRRRMWIEFTR